jgi:glycosyltransferase involved in cell wall biosynthesis
VPVVATDVGGVSEVVTDGVTGLLVKPGSGSELARGIEAVLADPAAARQRAIGARTLVEERFSHQASMTRLLDVYTELLSASVLAGLPS